MYERGEAGPDRPTIVLAHGWPDSAAMWGRSPTASAATGRFHVVTFDARGIGRSTPAMVHKPYAIGRMADDIDAVARAVSPDRPVHLVGHDWGSVQMWEYVGDPERQPWAATLHVDHRPVPRPPRPLDPHPHAKRPTPGNVGPVLAQAGKSSYVAYLHVPVASTLMWRLGFARLFRTWMKRVEHVPDDGQHPASTLPDDAIRGIQLYRTQHRPPAAAGPRSGGPTCPVQLVVTTRDHYLTPRLFADIEQWVPEPHQVDLDAGHWCTRTHPDRIAEPIDTYRHGQRARAGAGATHRFCAAEVEVRLLAHADALDPRRPSHHRTSSTCCTCCCRPASGGSSTCTSRRCR